MIVSSSDRHVEHDVDGIGHFDADLGEGRSDQAHRIGNDVHRPALHLSAGDVRAHLIGFLGIHPVVGGAGVFLLAAADERTVLNAGNVVLRGAVVVAAGKFFLIELEHLARFARFLAQRCKLLFASVDPDDVVRAGELGALFDERNDFLVLGGVCHIFFLLQKNSFVRVSERPHKYAARVPRYIIARRNQLVKKIERLRAKIRKVLQWYRSQIWLTSVPFFYFGGGITQRRTEHETEVCTY